MNKLLRQHDLIYERAPQQWIDGLPIANGALGAMIWGDGKPLRFTLDSYDIWEQRTVWGGDDPRFTYANLRRLLEEGRIDEMREVALRRRNMRFIDKPPPMPTRLSLGRMELKFKRKPTGFDARLDLHRATADMTIAFGDEQAKVSAFACATERLLIVDIKGELPTVALKPAPVDAESRKNFDSWGYPDPVVTNGRKRCVLRRDYSDGKQYSIVAQIHRRDDRMTIMLTIEDGVAEDDTTARARELLDAARDVGVKRLRGEHEDEWKQYWKSSAIVLPDSRLENLYYVEQYKHHSLSRPGTIPITLQGLWTTDGAWPPWRGSYTVDMNVQESYWPIYTANTIDAGDPLFEMYFNNLPRFRRVGEFFYGKPIAVVTSEHGPGGEPFPGHFSDEHSPGSGAWIGHMFWLRWLYTRDVAFLRRRAYPFLREMAQAYLHIAEKRGDGKYHIPFTETPEYFDGEPESLADDATYDLSLATFLFRALLDAQKYIEQPDPDVPRYRDLLDNLLEHPTDEGGGLALRPGLPLGKSHRHHSHLIGIYPLGVVEDERVMDASLAQLARMGPGEWSGWSYPWASMIAGRAGRGEMAYHYLQTYLDGFVLPNTLHGNFDHRDAGVGVPGKPAMTLEAGFAAAAAILELLLQSHGGLIRVFPSVPPTWGDAQFRTLRAEGAFVVSAKMADHAVRFVDIESEAGETCRIQNPFGGPCKLTDQTSGKTCDLRGNILKFTTKPGGRYRLTTDCKRGASWSIPRRGVNDRNWFGLKKHPRF
jgi:alpha-L-fucosidase 2